MCVASRRTRIIARRTYITFRARNNVSVTTRKDASAYVYCIGGVRARLNIVKEQNKKKEEEDESSSRSKCRARGYTYQYMYNIICIPPVKGIL